MQIIIQRHGFPDVGEWGRIYSKDMYRWIKTYNDSGVIVNQPPCQQSIDSAKDSYAICSTLRRSKHSAELLQVESVECAPLFCEVGLPVIHIPFVNVSPHMWSMIFRVFWFFGISKQVETKKEAIARAVLARQTLEALAQKHDRVLLIGHGIMNRLIAKELIKNGWRGGEGSKGGKYSGFRYWEFNVFNK